MHLANFKKHYVKFIRERINFLDLLYSLKEVENNKVEHHSGITQRKKSKRNLRNLESLKSKLINHHTYSKCNSLAGKDCLLWRNYSALSASAISFARRFSIRSVWL